MYSTYCIGNFFWNILECSFFCVQFQKHLLAPSGVSVSQLLTEHKNLTAAAVAAAAAVISHRSVHWVAPQLKMVKHTEGREFLFSCKYLTSFWDIYARSILQVFKKCLEIEVPYQSLRNQDTSLTRLKKGHHMHFARTNTGPVVDYWSVMRKYLSLDVKVLVLGCGNNCPWRKYWYLDVSNLVRKCCQKSTLHFWENESSQLNVLTKLLLVIIPMYFKSMWMNKLGLRGVKLSLI